LSESKVALDPHQIKASTQLHRDPIIPACLGHVLAGHLGTRAGSAIANPNPFPNPNLYINNITSA